MAENGEKNFSFSSKPSLVEMLEKQQEFNRERNWNQFRSPRNLLLAMVGEVGELAEIFQWKGEVKEGLPEFTEAEREHVGVELSDVFLYLIMLAEKCHVDLPMAVMKKIEKNAKKYPAELVYGKSGKYTTYQQNVDSNGEKQNGDSNGEKQNVDSIGEKQNADADNS